jgi:hypothetical protein
MNYWVLLFATLIPALFDTILHGISHSGHGVLDSIWVDEKNQRQSDTRYLGTIQWHILIDAISGLSISLIFIFTDPENLAEWLPVGILIAILISLPWFHFYSAFETSLTTTRGMALIEFIKYTLTIFLIGIIWI